MSEITTPELHQDERIPLPSDIDGITAVWLQSALALRRPNISIRSITLRQIIQGTGTKILIDIDRAVEDANSDVPRSVCLKGGYSPSSDYLMPRGRYVNEAVFYNLLAPHVEIRRPNCFFAQHDRRGQTVTVMEDLALRHVHFNLATGHLAVEAVASGLNQLASLHARWWNAPLLHQISSLGPFLPGGGHEERQRRPETWNAIMQLPRASRLPAFAKDLERIGGALDNLRNTHRKEPLCLLHGDPHIGNTYLETPETLGFYDWQTIARGSWAHDVNYFIGTSLLETARRHHERQLLASYLNALQTAGGPPIEETTAWDLYRLHTVYGLFTWTVNTVEMQPEENNVVLAERLAAAVDDHDTLRLLGQ